MGWFWVNSSYHFKLLIILLVYWFEKLNVVKALENRIIKMDSIFNVKRPIIMEKITSTENHGPREFLRWVFSYFQAWLLCYVSENEENIKRHTEILLVSYLNFHTSLKRQNQKYQWLMLLNVKVDLLNKLLINWISITFNIYVTVF